MARSLLDVNVMIALLDASHLFHGRAHEWWAQNRSEGWASCPITENGVVRIMSQPAYSKQVSFSVSQLIGRLSTFQTQTDHQFWPDKVSITEGELFQSSLILRHRQLTDVYLLALAVKNGGRLVTFDQGIPLAAVAGAQHSHLCFL